MLAAARREDAWSIGMVLDHCIVQCITTVTVEVRARCALAQLQCTTSARVG